MTVSVSEINQAAENFIADTATADEKINGTPGEVTDRHGTTTKNLQLILSELEGMGASLFDTEALGLANTSEGDLFLVKGVGSVFAKLYKNVSGLAVDQNISQPSSEAVDNVSESLTAVTSKVDIFNSSPITVSDTQVTFPRMRVRPATGAQVNVKAGVFGLSQSNSDNLYYYVDTTVLDGNGEYSIVTATDSSGLHGNPEKLWFATSAFGHFQPREGLHVVYDADEARLAALENTQTENVAAAPVVMGTSARLMMDEFNPHSGRGLSQAYTVVSASGRMELQPPIAGTLIKCGGLSEVGLTHLGSISAEIQGINTFSVYAGQDRTFSGQGASNLLTMTGGGVVTARSVGSEIAVTLSEDATPSYSTIIYTPSRAVAIGGQSHGNQVFNAGLEGLSRALNDANLDSHVSGDWGFLNISEGGTGVVFPGTNGSFWDVSTDTVATLGDAKGQIIDDWVAAGNPRPEVFTFDCGDADRNVFAETNPNTGLPYTVADLAYYVGQYLDYLRSKCANAADCVMVVYGSAEHPTSDNVSEEFCTASREAYIIAAESRGWVHMCQGKEMRARPMFDVHLNNIGNFRHGYMIGRTIGWALNTVTDQKFIEASTTFTPQGREVIVALTAASGESVVLPEPPLSDKYYPGPFPLGLGVISNGGSAVSDLIPIARAELLSDGRLKLWPENEADFRNARLITVAGHLKNALIGHRITDTSVEDAVTGRGILPSRVIIDTAE